MIMRPPILKPIASVWRSYLVPVFTLRQAIFLIVAGIMSGVLALAFEHGLVIAAILLVSCVGALSMSSPFVLIARSADLNRVENALKAGEWISVGNNQWVRPESKLSAWENDLVHVVAQPDVMIIYGPYYTLSRLKRIILSTKRSHADLESR